MNVEPINSQCTFGNKIYQYTKSTSYGKCIHGSNRGFDYDVYVKENEITKDIEHKLYCVFKDGEWVKSFLRFFNKNKVCKELRSQAK